MKQTKPARVIRMLALPLFDTPEDRKRLRVINDSMKRHKETMVTRWMRRLIEDDNERAKA